MRNSMVISLICAVALLTFGIAMRSRTKAADKKQKSQIALNISQLDPDKDGVIPAEIKEVHVINDEQVGWVVQNNTHKLMVLAVVGVSGTALDDRGQETDIGGFVQTMGAPSPEVAEFHDKLKPKGYGEQLPSPATDFEWAGGQKFPHLKSVYMKMLYVEFTDGTWLGDPERAKKIAANKVGARKLKAYISSLPEDQRRTKLAQSQIPPEVGLANEDEIIGAKRLRSHMIRSNHSH